MERVTEVPTGTKGMAVLLPLDVHRAVKIAAAEDELTMRQMVLALIEEALERREAETAVK